MQFYSIKKIAILLVSPLTPDERPGKNNTRENFYKTVRFRWLNN